MSLYLVTGGAGYIGSQVAKRIRDEGHDVRVIDNLENGVRERVTSDMEFFEADIRDQAAMNSVMIGCAGVFHLAALPRVAYSIEHPFEVHEVNTMGTLAVLDAAKANGVKRVVLSSTSAIYGNAVHLPVTEESLVAPLNPYGLSKFFGERCLAQYAELYGLETVSLRYFNAYGPGMREGGSYPTAISAFTAARRGKRPLIVHGTGEQSRDLVHVRDIARANWLAMHAETVGKGEIINIGSGSSMTILTIAKRMQGAEGIIYEERRAGDAMHTLAGIQKAKELLNWEPSISLEEGLNEVLRVEGLV
ncbi:NAD-dependent epimerase/dehydratase family protein [Patescibacteria group bacterium]|nr:NAD-dependent epimerase/dehydratase family protein [Patescibacteria group bacterium]